MRLALVTALVGLSLVIVAPRAEAGRGTTSLKYLPDDTTLVIVSDVARARGSRIFKKLFDVLREQHASLDTLAAAQPLEKLVDTIVVGGNASKQGVIVLEGRIDKLAAEAKKISTSSEKHAGVTYWVTPDGEVAVFDKKLVFTSAGLMTATIDRAKHKKAKGPTAVRTIIAATQPNVAVLGGSVLEPALRDQLKGSLGSEPQWVAFSFAMAHTLTIDARLRFADDAAAAAAVKTISDQLTADRRGQLEAFVGKDFADSIAVDLQPSSARIAASLTAEELDKIISFLKMVM